MAGLQNSLDFDYTGLYNSLGILAPNVPGTSSKARTQPLGTENAHGYRPAPSGGDEIARVTPEGLNVRSVTTTAVDPFTGNPLPGNIADPRLRPSNPNVDLQPGMGVDQAALGYGDPGANTGTGPRMATDNPALVAIGNAVVPMPRPRPLLGGDKSFAAPMFGNMPVAKSVATPDTRGLYGRPMAPIPGVAYEQAGGGGGGNPAVIAQLVRLASGATVPVGSTGSAQGGRYTYAVQPNGAVLNTTTGRVTAPAPVQAAPQQFDYDAYARQTFGNPNGGAHGGSLAGF